MQFAADIAGEQPHRKMKIAIRPENIKVHRPADSTSGIEATVLDAIFKGNHISYLVEAGADRLHILTLPPLDGRPFAVGDEVRLTVPQSHVIALTGEAMDG
jgi:ABC-type Fe3+/spermidine/putrescine transport system ATPase subunit